MQTELSAAEITILIAITGGSALPETVDERDESESPLDAAALAALEVKGLVRIDRTETGSVRSIMPSGYTPAIVEALCSSHRTGVPMGDWKHHNES